MFKIMLALLTAITLAACAKVEVKRITAETDSNSDGVRFYRPMPYLLVSPVRDEKGEIKTTTAQIVWLPDLSQEYQARVRTGIGAVELSPTLTDGWNLTALGAKVDSKVPETITAISALIPSATGAIKPMIVQPGAAPPEGHIPPGLYPIYIDRASGMVTKIGPAVPLIVPEPPKKEGGELE